MAKNKKKSKNRSKLTDKYKYNPDNGYILGIGCATIGILVYYIIHFFK